MWLMFLLALAGAGAIYGKKETPVNSTIICDTNLAQHKYNVYM